MLYYRKDLLDGLGAKVPETWDDPIDSAKKLSGSGQAKFGFVWQAKQAEVLVCDLVSFIGSNDGTILQSDGKTVSIADDAAVEAVQLMHDLIKKYQVTPEDVLSWDEEPSRQPFTSGEAAFLRNWSYVWRISQSKDASSVVDKVGVAPLPHFPGKKSAARIGGYQYGVNASSKNKDAAIEFVRWMSSPETQLRFATQLGLCPTRSAVLDDPKIAQEQPFMQRLKSVFIGAIGRPVTPKYPQVTLVLQSAVSTAIPTVVTSKMFGWLFEGQNGIVNFLLRTAAIIHHNVDWYGSPDFALATIITADVWKTTPFMALLLLAGLQTIQESLGEASLIDGANSWQRFWYVRLPLLAPSLLIASMFRALDAFRIFDLVYVLTGGGPADSTEVLSTLTYKHLFSALEIGYGSSLSTMMFITEIAIAALFSWLLFWKMREAGQ